MAPRGKRAKAVENKSVSSALLSALRFISVAQKEDGLVYQSHSILANNYAIAFDGVIAAGARIDEDLQACPHTLRLVAALSKCGESLAITQLDRDRLSIKSEKFKAVIPCAEYETLNHIQPDMPCASIDDRLKQGLSVVSCLISDNAKTVVESAILIQANSMVSTNRHVMLEFWHGIDLPPNLLVPKSFAQAIVKSPKKLARFGFSQSSVTFYFEDESWIRTQLYQEQYPNVSRVLDAAANPWPLPQNFYLALGAVESFCEDNRLYFREGLLASHSVEGAGATYEVAGLPNGLIFNPNYLRVIEPHIKTIDFIGQNGIAYFYGESVRGAICGIKE
jgi:hypothetical protein